MLKYLQTFQNNSLKMWVLILMN